MDKDKQEVMDHDHEEPNEEVKMKRSSPSEVYAVPIAVRECNICGKTFNNGKALGGHRRSHFLAAKKHSQKVKIDYSNPSKRSNNKAICDDDDDNDDGKHTCYLCKKDFPSQNALFGHMRSHPERDWWGVCPPPIHHKSSSSLSSDSTEQYKKDHDDDCVDKDLSLPRWQKTDKRGRRSIGAYEAAENLVYMRCNYLSAEPNSPEPPTPCKEKGIAAEEEPSSSEKHMLKKIKFYVSGSLKCENKNDGDADCDSDKVNGEKCSSGTRDEKISANMNVYVTSESVNTEVMEDDVRFSDERIKEMVKKKKKNKGKKIKKLLLKPKTQDLESEDKGFVDKIEKKLNGYECDICWKSFPTFQALGGHKSIHNKEKNITTIVVPKLSDAIAEDNNCKDSDVGGLVMEKVANNIKTETLVGTLPLNNEFVGPRILDFDLNESPNDMHDD